MSEDLACINVLEMSFFFDVSERQILDHKTPVAVRGKTLPPGAILSKPGGPLRADGDLPNGNNEINVLY